MGGLGTVLDRNHQGSTLAEVESIADKLGVDGRTYLEKVVQLQIDIAGA